MHVWWRSRYKLTDLFFFSFWWNFPHLFYTNDQIPTNFARQIWWGFGGFGHKQCANWLTKWTKQKWAETIFMLGIQLLASLMRRLLNRIWCCFFVRLRFVSLEIRSYKFAHDLNIWFACVKPQSSDRSFMWVCGWANRLKSNSAAVKGFDFSLSHTHTETHTTESLTRKLL